MKHAATTLIALAGLIPSALAQESNLQLLDTDRLVPTHAAGVLYLNLTTGERTLTRYATTEIPEISSSHSTATLFDYWMSIDENPCWDDPRQESFGLYADATDDASLGIVEPVVMFDFGDLPFDSKITGVLLTTVTLALEETDSNGDGILDTGIDTVAVYYDALSEANSTSIAPPTAIVRIESLPGDIGDVPGWVSEYDLIVDFGDSWFELGDSDGQGLGPMNLPGANSGQDIAGTFQRGSLVVENTLDGLADFQYLQYYAQHGGNDKVTEDSTFIKLGAPEGDVSISTHMFTSCTCTPTPTCTCGTTTITIFNPHPLPQAQGTFESIGIAILGPGGDTTNLNWTLGDLELQGGCCIWFGGLDCAGFLDQFVEDPPYNPTWYGYSPYAQLAHGLFSDESSEDPCARIDFNNDTILDNGDIGTFIQLFLQQDLATDMNGDGVCDNGDIGAFVNLFLACTG